MSLANFFDKAALAASHILKGYDRAAFADQLQAQVAGLAFDGAAARSPEGQVTLELAVSLLARLYPRLSIVALEAGDRVLSDRLVAQAISINPAIEVVQTLEGTTACLAVGGSPVPTRSPVSYVGSDGWLVRSSPDTPVGSGDTQNPFGAGAAACFGAARLFRQMFSEQLTASDIETGWTLSLLDYTLNPASPNNPDLGSIDLGESFLAGLGAIGNGAVWALARTPRLHGTLHLIDHEAAELSNLQRYVLTTQAHIGLEKTRIAMEALQGSALNLQPHSQRWGEYLASRGNYVLERVAVALDSAEDRCAVQAALPQWIANAWTQVENLGISRHNFADDQACLMCLYLPNRKVPNQSELVAQAIGLPHDEQKVRELLYRGQAVGAELIERIAAALTVPPEPLLRFADKPLQAFYSEAICGGIVLGLGGGPGSDAARAEVPMAFQSALAGILLAAELVAQAGRLRPPLPTVTRIDLLRPMTAYLSQPERKHASGRCICQDADYQQVYRRKYKGSVAARG